MKKVLLIFLIFASSFVFPGCWDRHEINDIALITGVALDKKENNSIEVTVEIISPGMEAGATGGEGGGVGKTVTRSGVGVNIAEALEKLQERLPRKVFWGHSEVFVIGEELAKEGISDEIEYFLRHREPRVRAYVFVAKNRAKEVMALLPPIEPTSAEVLREMAIYETFFSVTLLELMQMLQSDSGVANLSMIQVLPPAEGGSDLETIAYISGSAILKEDKMIGTLDDRVTRGVNWIKDEIEHGNISIKPKEGEGYISGAILEANTELIPEKANGPWKMTIKSDVVLEVTINETSLDLGIPEDMEIAQKEVNEHLEQRMKEAVEEVQKGMKADIFDFARVIETTYPKEWEKMKGDWEEIFPTVQVTFDINTDIIRRGQVQGFK
ncbi:Ger(x)C family spore germination protein [Alkalihalobacillus deserti]|uniref:Ger(x)C family spore germination protein n=1 Tax=Alkalihalobacillus deserti TaxID=2879466 RepID=UPI001D15003D|nr:Ger(x)C family spore germination protein [Alkalihalobacillus deserti]